MEQIIQSQEAIQEKIEMLTKHSDEIDEESFKREILNYLLDEESGFEV